MNAHAPFKNGTKNAVRFILKHFGAMEIYATTEPWSLESSVAFVLQDYNDEGLQFTVLFFKDGVQVVDQICCVNGPI